MFWEDEEKEQPTPQGVQIDENTTLTPEQVRELYLKNKTFEEKFSTIESLQKDLEQRKQTFETLAAKTKQAKTLTEQDKMKKLEQEIQDMKTAQEVLEFRDMHNLDKKTTDAVVKYAIENDLDRLDIAFKSWAFDNKLGKKAAPMESSINRSKDEAPSSNKHWFEEAMDELTENYT